MNFICLGISIRLKLIRRPPRGPWGVHPNGWFPKNQPVREAGHRSCFRPARAAKPEARANNSLADAYAAALAKTQDATLVTGDLEFQTLAREIKIKWLK